MKKLIKQYFLSTHKSVDSIEIFKNDEPDNLWSVFLTQRKSPNVRDETGREVYTESEVTFRHDIDSDMMSVIRDWGLEQILKQKEDKKNYYREYNKKK